MKKTFIITITALACGVIAPQAQAQKFAVKAYDEICLTAPLSATATYSGMTTNSSANSFGVDFGYTFWRLGGNALEANIGLGYTVASATFKAPGLEFSYDAPASADVDGNPYQRHTQLSDMSQKTNFGYFNIPVSLQYQYRIAKWVGIHVDLGFGLGFRCGGSTGVTSGTATTYGVYPEYDDLVIKADYLNDFGERKLDTAIQGEAEIKGFDASVMCGAGFEFYVARPVSIDLGIRYNAGLTDVFAGKCDISRNVTAGNAPVSFTATQGQEVRAFADYVSKSRFSPLSLRIGVNVRF